MGASGRGLNSNIDALLWIERVRPLTFISWCRYNFDTLENNAPKYDYKQRRKTNQTQYRISDRKWAGKWKLKSQD